MDRGEAVFILVMAKSEGGKVSAAMSRLGTRR